jgi:REP element-mobilizing transposase RayT
MNRGAGHQKIFKNNFHRNIFLNLLEESHKIFNLKIFAYCLMDNHYHLLVSTPNANLPRIMRHINGVYTQQYNRLTGTDGPLFRGRYKAKLIGDDCYQLIVSRYIHLNAVEAGIVNHPADYKWSSYGAYLGLSESPAWLFKNTIINQLAETKSLSHVKNYQDYVEEKHIEEINIFSSIKHTAPILGSESFKQKVLSEIDTAPIIQSCSSDLKRAKTIPTIDLIISQVCVAYNINREALMHSHSGMKNWPKTISVYICRKIFGHLLKDISQAFKFYRHEAVSSIVHKCHSRLVEHPELSEEIDVIVESIKRLILQ